MKKAKSYLKNFLVVSLIIAMLAGFAACGGGESTKESSESENQSKELSDDFSMITSQVVTLNPIISQSTNDKTIFYLINMDLMREYGDKAEPDAAESFDVNEDSTEYTFHLRDGLVWSDGTPITAKDFEYYFYSTLNPADGSPNAAIWYAVKNARKFSEGEISDWNEVGIKCPDDKTVVFTMEQPTSSFERVIAINHIYPLNQGFAEKIGKDKLGSDVDCMMYSGPYIVTDWVLDNSFELVKNDKYWNSANSFPTKNLHFMQVEDANTKIAMFEDGTVDAVEQISSQYYNYLPDDEYRVVTNGKMYLWVNQNAKDSDQAKLLSNTNFRQALSYGFDREATVNAVDSAAVAANRCMYEELPGPKGGKFVDEYPVDAVPTTGDVDKAKEYLDKALKETGFNDISNLPQISLITWDTPVMKNLGETLIDQWKQNLGLTNIQLEQYVVGTAIGKLYSLDFNLFLITWDSGIFPVDIMDNFATGGSCNFGYWSDPAFDKMVAAADNELDPVKKAELTHAAEQYYSDAAPVIPIYSQGVVNLVHSNVEGFQSNGESAGYEFNNLKVYKK